MSIKLRSHVEFDCNEATYKIEDLPSAEKEKTGFDIRLSYSYDGETHAIIEMSFDEAELLIEALTKVIKPNVWSTRYGYGR